VADEIGRRPVYPLVRQVDSLLRSQQDADVEVPVLTEVVEVEREGETTLDAVVLEALARQLERAVLERLGPEFGRLIEEKLARALSAQLDASVGELRSELIGGLDQMAREAVSSAIENTLGIKRGEAAAQAGAPSAPRAEGRSEDD